MPQIPTAKHLQNSGDSQPGFSAFPHVLQSKIFPVRIVVGKQQPLQMFSIFVSWLFHTTSLKDRLVLVSLKVKFLSERGQFIPVGIQVWKLCLGILPRYTSSTEYVWQQREEQYNESER